jgi:GTPase
VVAGTLKAGVVRVGESLLLGPDPADGVFRPATVRSIHYKRCPVGAAFAGQTAALALRRAGRAAVRVRKGMALVAAVAGRPPPAAAWEFEADVAVLTHSTTIGPRYQAVIHCEQIRQTAAVVSMSAERMRSGDRARVQFRFIQRPEFISIGSRLMFREGRAKGVGVVTAVGGEAAPAGAG